jgi:hypothetical protein
LAIEHWRLAIAPKALVVPRGNAPRSLAYQASALLLSYGTEAIRGFIPKRTGRKVKLTLAGLMRMTRRGL